jgi:outer membrane protein OmpA-like peptidoglycan-associated protein
LIRVKSRREISLYRFAFKIPWTHYGRFDMQREFRSIVAATTLAVGMIFASSANAAPGGVKVGTLTCDVASGWGFVFGSSRDLHCVFAPDNRGTEHYTGTISKFGVDIGYTDGGVLVWGVFAPSSDLRPGALDGDYVGATANATVGIGIGANALIGGGDKSIALQPLSVEGNTGLNVAAGIGAISLHAEAQPPAPPPPPPPAVKTFIVFFDFNQSDLTVQAQSIVADAVRIAKSSGFVRVHVTGHTDTVGSDSYNQALSIRRAQAVKDEMVHDGLDADGISVEGMSFRDPLVTTGPGVREPQNRRAVIDLGG